MFNLVISTKDKDGDFKSSILYNSIANHMSVDSDLSDDEIESLELQLTNIVGELYRYRKALPFQGSFYDELDSLSLSNIKKDK